ncbi:MAG: hypothetical protein Unbinned4234contig1002_15 [Prokaryotic dsDNA virus sp.]|jgi:hypothetical protein|nr:MAG: hypothetical protein Unbinned4234contig1002_15 [Prokaryotic dsDNA virus sp.]|tara:strand:- start:12038 stop:12439 length:402 start_codon:yes stop_codon:yes gene_type:complete
MKELEIIKFAEKEYKTPFKWGVNDCNTLILKFLDEIYGWDVLDIAFERYSNRKEAIKLQKELPTLTEVCLNNGARKIPPSRARMGDILIISKRYFELGHICLGSKVLSVIEEEISDMAFIPSFNDFDWGLRVE